MLGNHTISPVALRWKAPCRSHAYFPMSGAFVGSKVLAFAGIKGLSGFKDPSGCDGDPYPTKGRSIGSGFGRSSQQSLG